MKIRGKIYIVVVLLIVFLVLTVLVKLNNKDKYVVEKEQEVVDNDIVAFQIETDSGYEKAKNIPISGYVLNSEESFCGVKQEDNTYLKETVEITYIKGKVTIDKVNKNGMRCFLYFDKATVTEAILANNTIDERRISGSFASTFTEDTSGRIFKGPADDYGETTYFFAGKDPNNWVHFANKWWRIIRINGDGSVRLIYSGSDAAAEPQTMGEDTQIGTSEFNINNNDNAYIGYMYGATGQNGDNAYALTHANTNDSTIKGVIDKWYDNNIGNNAAYSNKIETNTGFCGDRQTMSGSGWDSFTILGYGTNSTTYVSFIRLYSNNSWKSTQTPSLKCSQSNDLYTVSSASIGNKALTYPIGLITSDEVVFSGGFGGTASSEYWLFEGGKLTGLCLRLPLLAVVGMTCSI